jgi:pectin methylesterase-like acyl-CoA thioesterase
MPLHDPHAVYLTSDQFDVSPDAEGDDSAALQAAIDTVQKRYRFGIVFIPEGTYQITKTIYVWKGIRLIGYGENRPVFVLEENTPGYDEGEGKYMIHFVQ